MSASLSVTSEIGRLRTVIVHRPGTEVEQMTPSTARELLYNDIVPVQEVMQEHDGLTRVLGTVAEVIEIEDAVVGALQDPEAFQRFQNEVRQQSPGVATEGKLPESPEDLAAALIHGIRNRTDRIGPILEGPEYLLPPVPNLYFTRDASFVIGEVPFQSRMAHRVRDNETKLAATALRKRARVAPVVPGANTIPLGQTIADRTKPTTDRTKPTTDRTEHDGLRIEGGDVHVLGPDRLLFGVGERTNARAVDEVLQIYMDRTQRPVSAVVIVLPQERATIHLDMVFTMVDHGAALAFTPFVLGHHAVRAFRIDAELAATWQVREHRDLVTTLEGFLDTSLEIIPCGGTNEGDQVREQWFSGCNSFALAPGKIVVYRNNVRTLEQLDRHGFNVVTPEEAGSTLEGPLVDKDGNLHPGRVAVAIGGVELARGGGGPRCMTMPVLRDAVTD